MHEDSGWRPTPCQSCDGHEVWTHNGPHEINVMASESEGKAEGGDEHEDDG